MFCFACLLFLFLCVYFFINCFLVFMFGQFGLALNFVLSFKLFASYLTFRLLEQNGFENGYINCNILTYLSCNVWRIDAKTRFCAYVLWPVISEHYNKWIEFISTYTSTASSCSEKTISHRIGMHILSRIIYCMSSQMYIHVII